MARTPEQNSPSSCRKKATKLERNSSRIQQNTEALGKRNDTYISLKSTTVSLSSHWPPLDVVIVITNLALVAASSPLWPASCRTTSSPWPPFQRWLRSPLLNHSATTAALAGSEHPTSLAVPAQQPRHQWPAPIGRRPTSRTEVGSGPSAGSHGGGGGPQQEGEEKRRWSCSAGHGTPAANQGAPWRRIDATAPGGMANGAKGCGGSRGGGGMTFGQGAMAPQRGRLGRRFSA